MANNKGPFLPDIDTIIAAGIDPKTGLPYKWGSCDINNANLRSDMFRAISQIDEIDALSRYKWYNLPDGLSSELMERMIYYRGQVMFFYLEGEFYALPFCLNGDIDVYGNYNEITPLPFNGHMDDEKPWINGLSFKVVKDIKLDRLTLDDLEKSAVIIRDRSQQIGQNIIPRYALHQGIINFESNMLPYMNTALLNSTGVQGMKVNSQDEASNVTAASTSVTRAALTGQKYIPVVGSLDFQGLSDGNVAKAEEFLLAFQSVDNFRLSMYGIENGGLFQKKQFITDTQNGVNNANTKPMFVNGLAERQKACDIINSIWGLGIWCEASEAVTGVDFNGDGVVLDEQDQSGMNEGEQPIMNEEVE